VLALSSAVANAFASGVDAVVSSLFIHDPWALGVACFLVGVIIALIFSIILSIRFKDKSLGSKAIDPSFNHLRFIRREEIKYQLLSAFGNAILTIGYYILLSILADPSVVIPFTQMVILYLVLMESITEKDMPTLVEVQSALIVTFGAILGSISFSGDINLLSLAIVFLVINPGWMISSIYQRKLKLLKINGKPNDSLNIRFWNVLFAFLITSGIVLIYDISSGANHLLNGIIYAFRFFNWISIMGIGTFFSLVLYIRALGIGKASVTQAVKSTAIMFSIPVSIILAYLNIIPSFSTDPTMIAIRGIGIILMILGIASYALTLVKAYIFIEMKPGYPILDIMRKLWDIRGVTRVAAVAGKYDFIIKIRTRTLVKGYEKIIRKLNEIEGIKKYKWESVLREWEKL
ncbi:MAG TPA: Lrp/AsnC family transcriptional regulator, partial [Thermoplasmatales archaeon]|nr:Lrp/AsnC family transcriptional regulator [Thermoplasmatales archaeon]